jgi:regulator of RNase E activity RraA
VLPGDVIVGDGEGVMVVPRAVAERVIEASYEQEQREDFIMAKIRNGSSILGVYPADERTLREYEDWKRSNL